MLIEVLSTSYNLAYEEHVRRLLFIPNKYIPQIKPNERIPYPEIFNSYNSDVAKELDDYGDRLRFETMRVLKAKEYISSLDKEEIQRSVEKCLEADLYVDRFDIFVKSIDITLSRYGIIFEKEKCRVDLSRTKAKVHAKNTCRRIQEKVLNDVDVFFARGEY